MLKNRSSKNLQGVRRTAQIITTIAILFSGATMSQAAVIDTMQAQSSSVVFSQLPEISSAQFQASIADPVFGFQSLLDDFSLVASETSITEISFWTNEFIGALNSNFLQVSVYAPDASGFADSLFSISAMTGDGEAISKTLVDDTIGLYKHTFSIDNLTLSAGTYFLGVGADLVNNLTPVGWTNAVGNDSFEYVMGAGVVFPTGISQLANISAGNLAFEIAGETVIPVSAPSMIACVAIFAMLLYRRK